MFEEKKGIKLQEIERERQLAVEMRLKEYKENYIHRIKKLITSWKEHQVWIDTMLGQTQDDSVVNALEGEREQSLLELKSTIAEYRYILKTLSQINCSMTINNFKDEVEAVHRSFAFTYNLEASYFEEVTMLNYLLDGLAYHEMKYVPEKTFADMRDQIKRDLYKAYFKGNSFFLRKIDKAFGKGMLRKINAVPTIRVSTKVQQYFQQVLNEIHMTVQTLRTMA